SVSKKLGAELTIQGVSIHFFDHLELNHVLLRDLRKDTLIYIGKLDADYRLLAWSSENIHFDNIMLEKAVVKLVIPENDSSLNLKFLIDFFQPEIPNPNAKSPRLSSNRIVLNNCFFNFRNENYRPSANRAFNE